MIQFAEIAFRNGGSNVDLSGAFATNPGGANPSSEGPEKAIDGSTATKWLDINVQSLVITFPSPVYADEFSFTTGSQGFGFH